MLWYLFVFLVTITEKIILLCDGQIQAFIFDGYWEDMRSIEAFYQANMQSTKKANMGFKSVTLIPGKAESIMPVHRFSEVLPTLDYPPTNTNFILS
jgi:ADP-glucose pyrophosphorylase